MTVTEQAIEQPKKQSWMSSFIPVLLVATAFWYAAISIYSFHAPTTGYSFDEWGVTRYVIHDKGSMAMDCIKGERE